MSKARGTKSTNDGLLTKTKKIGRNDLCWCNSGLKYKKCHWLREKERRLPVSAIRDKTNRERALEVCLHPQASDETCGRVISSHTLQRARVLKAIAENNHVSSFHPFQPRDDGDLTLHRRGWRQASTFSAFCDRHDAKAFETLENGEFTGSKEQIFLIAYRAICWELYHKVQEFKVAPVMKEYLELGVARREQQSIHGDSRILMAALKRGAQDFADAKAMMDRSFESRDYQRYSALEIVMNGALSVASTGAISPNVSVGGSRLQRLEDMRADAQWLAFGTDVSERGVSVVFLWLSENEAPRRYMEEVLSLSEEFLPQFLCQFFFVHCENTYFSPVWWSSLKWSDKAAVKKMVANVNPYFSPHRYRENLVPVPWEVERHRLL